MAQEDQVEQDGQGLIWFSQRNSKTNKQTSLWHLMHSYRIHRYDRQWNGKKYVAGEFFYPYVLAYCGFTAGNPTARYNEPKLRKCSGCSNVAVATSRDTELPREDLIIEQ